MVRLTFCLMAFASIANADNLFLPIMSGRTGDGRVYVTSVVAKNQNAAPAQCSFFVGDSTAVDTIAANTHRSFPDFFASTTAAAAAQVRCDRDVGLLSRIQLSSDGGRTFDRGRVYRAVRIAGAKRTTLRLSSDGIAVGEVTGAPVSVRVTTREGAATGSRTTYQVGAKEVRLIAIERPIDVSIDVDIEVVEGNGLVVATNQSTDYGEIDSTPSVHGAVNANASEIDPTRLLGIASFKAAPFREPVTGLVFMRERWFDPRTGSFMTPDPMRYADSSNLYAFAGGDPVLGRDPTGMLDPSVREHFRQKEQRQARQRSEEFCRANPSACARRDARGQAIARIIGGTGQAITGFGAAASTGPLPEPVTKGFGITAAVRGVDNVFAGAVQLWTGEPQQTATAKALFETLVASGVAPSEAARITGWTEVAVDVTSSVGAGIVQMLSAATLPANVARTFEHGKYAARILDEDLIVFRGEGSRFGRWYGAVEPQSAAEAERLYNVIDYGNDLVEVSRYSIPKGTLVYEGQVAGGTGRQLYIPDPRAAGVKLMNTRPLTQYGQ